MLSEAIEDYLKAIYELESQCEAVSTTDLAKRLKVSPASVTGMLNKLKELGLVAHRRYRGAKLTADGRARALAVIRNHRLAETFLAEKLGVPLEAVHAEAHKWEHILSDNVAQRLDALLGHPAADPHGSPIPTSDGKIVLHNHVPLAELSAGQSAIVAEVSDQNPDLLRYLGELKLLPKARLLVIERQPDGELITIRVQHRQHTVGQWVTRHVFVRILEVLASEPGTELPG